MDFIKQMKKREFIEMSLKTLAALLAAFLAIILMEGMIYSIQLHAIETKGAGHTALSNSTIAYCIHRPEKNNEDRYFVIYYNEDSAKEWSGTKGQYFTKAECLAMEGKTVEEVVMHAPNAFEFSISGVHYVVMSIFVLAIAGFFTYKFIALAKEYQKIENNFKNNGTIEF